MAFRAHTIRRGLLVAVLFGAIFGALATPVQAINSTSYKIDEDFVGGGGSIDSSSASYRSQDTIGATAVGDGASTAGTKTQPGATTTNDPTLEFSVSTSSISLGALLTSQTATATASFSVRNYTSYGYIVQVLGTPPKIASHTMTALASPTASATATEQFGINLAANTAPTTFGAAPLQVPDSSYSFGAAPSGYNTANQYKYASGDTIASAPKSSGQTTYTISYIANISTSTPQGQYSTSHQLVCTGTY